MKSFPANSTRSCPLLFIIDSHSVLHLSFGFAYSAGRVFAQFWVGIDHYAWRGLHQNLTFCHRLRRGSWCIKSAFLIRKVLGANRTIVMDFLNVSCHRMIVVCFRIHLKKGKKKKKSWYNFVFSKCLFFIFNNKNKGLNSYFFCFMWGNNI